MVDQWNELERTRQSIYSMRRGISLHFDARFRSHVVYARTHVLLQSVGVELKKRVPQQGRRVGALVRVDRLHERRQIVRLPEHAAAAAATTFVQSRRTGGVTAQPLAEHSTTGPNVKGRYGRVCRVGVALGFGGHEMLGFVVIMYVYRIWFVKKGRIPIK